MSRSAGTPGPSRGAPQHWDPERYRREAGFVADLGRPVLDLLAPRPGERILDLGCGDGRLTLAVSESEAEVFGCDLSHEQVRAAHDDGIRVCVADGAALPFAATFDAVFSNAALHWMTSIDAVLSEVRRALKPGGRFVAEMGGAGNVARIVGALAATMAQRGLNFSAAWPWYFPTPSALQAKLEAAGFRVATLQHFVRPTPLPGDIDGWLHTFAQSFLNQVPASERPDFLAEVRAALKPHLQAGDGQWTADYVRLRFRAERLD